MRDQLVELAPWQLRGVLLLAGLLGGLLRAIVNRTTQPLRSPKTVADIVIGGVFGLFLPRVASVTAMWAGLAPLEQFFATLVLTYFFNDVIQNQVLARLEVFVKLLGPPPRPPAA